MKKLGGAALSLAIATGAVLALTHALKHIDYEKVFGAVELLRNVRDRVPLEMSDRRVGLEPDHAGNDQRQADDPNRVGRFTEEHHANDDAADRTDAGPYRISRAERQRT